MISVRRRIDQAEKPVIDDVGSDRRKKIEYQDIPFHTLEEESYKKNELARIAIGNGTTRSTAIRALKALEKLHKRNRFLRPTDLELIVDGKVRHAVDVLTVRILDFLVDFGSALTLYEPVLGLRLVEPGFDGGFEEHVLRRNVLFILEVGGEELFDHASLHLWALCFAELDKSFPAVSIYVCGYAHIIVAPSYAILKAEQKEENR